MALMILYSQNNHMSLHVLPQQHNVVVRAATTAQHRRYTFSRNSLMLLMQPQQLDVLVHTAKTG